VRWRPCLGQVAEGMGWSAGVCGERLARPTGRIGLREEDRSRRRLVRRGRGRSFRYDQGDRRGKRALCGRGVFVGRGMKLEMERKLDLERRPWAGRGRVVEPDPHRSEDRPLHAEQIRRS